MQENTQQEWVFNQLISGRILSSQRAWQDKSITRLASYIERIRKIKVRGQYIHVHTTMTPQAKFPKNPYACYWMEAKEIKRIRTSRNSKRAA
jgi:hypothetical protein